MGSGVVEAGCKSIIAQRLKRSGMGWTVRGANAIISLRCVMKSNRFEDYWAERKFRRVHGYREIPKLVAVLQQIILDRKEAAA